MDLISRVLFPTPPSSYSVSSFPGELIWVPRSLNPQTSTPEDCLPLCLLQCEEACHLIIYLHSNFEDIGRCHGFCEVLRARLQVHVLVVEYPGYGIAPGQCDEEGAIEAAHVALRFAHEVLQWPWDRIVVFGRSIGTGPASALAAQCRLGGLVLAAPFLSVQELCRDYIGPAAAMVREKFPNQDNIALVRSPCLFVHGQKDEIVAVRHGRQLFESCQSRKRMVSPADMEHNSDLLADEALLLAPMWDFFRLWEGRPLKMQVPGWAFDKQLSPALGSLAGRLKHNKQPAACTLFGSGWGCTAGGCNAGCAQCGCGGWADQGMADSGCSVLYVEPTEPSVQPAYGSYDAAERAERRESVRPWTPRRLPIGEARRPEEDAPDEELSARMQHILQRVQEVASEEHHKVSETSQSTSTSFQIMGFAQV